MPIREYECLRCGLTFDKLILASDRPKIKCIECKSTRVRECVTAPGNYSIGGDNSASTRPRREKSNL